MAKNAGGGRRIGEVKGLRQAKTYPLKKAIKLPSTVTVLGQLYHVETVESFDLPLGANDSGTAIGWTSNAQGVIRLRGAGEQSRDCARDTLFHEVLHAVAWQLGVALEEGDVRRIATGLLDTIRRNPELALVLVSE